MTESKIPLLPCPFCGRVDQIEVTSREVYIDLIHMHGRACIAVTCWACNCEKMLTDKAGDYDLAVASLIAAWNTRKGVPHD